jgi:hypothetical protein
MSVAHGGSGLGGTVDRVLLVALELRMLLLVLRMSLALRMVLELVLVLVLGSLDAPPRVGVDVCVVPVAVVHVHLLLSRDFGQQRELQRDHRSRATCAPHTLLGYPAGMLVLELMRNSLVQPMHKRRLRHPSQTHQIRGRGSGSTAIVRSLGEGALLDVPQLQAVDGGEGARPCGDFSFRQILPHGDYALLRHATPDLTS